MPKQRAFKYKYPNEGRWDSRNNRWLTPKEDFRKMARQARLPDGSGVTVEELYKMFKKTAEEDVPGISQFCKYIISAEDLI